MIMIRTSLRAPLVLILITAVAAFIRLYRLDEVPAGFFCDEAAFGVNAYSILTHGTDEFGTPYPLFFRSFGDYKEAIPTYSIVPLVYLFGLQEWSVRLMSVVYGLINTLLLYGLGAHIKNKRVGLTSAFLGATMPWMFHYDRVAFHCSPYLCTLLMALFLLVSSPHRHPLRVSGFFAFLGLSLYTYSPSKLMVPLIALSASGVYLRHLWRRWPYTLLGLLMFCIIVIPFYKGLVTGEAIGRAQQLGLLEFGGLSLHQLGMWLRHYEVQLLPSTLFVVGEFTAITRHLTNYFPPMLISTAPFVLLGLARMFFEVSRRESIFLIILLIIFPLGATFTGNPYTHRSVFGAPMLALCAALGIDFLIITASRRGALLRNVVASACFFIISVNAALHFRYYIEMYPLRSSDALGWQYGPKEVIRYFREHSSEYDQLLLWGDFNAPHIFFSFYAPDHLCDNRCFIGSLEMFNPNVRQLFALTPDFIAANSTTFSFSPVHTVYYPDGNPALVLVTIKK